MPPPPGDALAASQLLLHSIFRSKWPHGCRGQRGLLLLAGLRRTCRRCREGHRRARTGTNSICAQNIGDPKAFVGHLQIHIPCLPGNKFIIINENLNKIFEMPHKGTDQKNVITSTVKIYTFIIYLKWIMTRLLDQVMERNYTLKCRDEKKDNGTTGRVVIRPCQL